MSVNTLTPSGLDATILNEERALLGYSDFATIDWIKDYQRDRSRLKLQTFRSKGEAFREASKAWILVISIGIITGLFAAYIGIISGWLADLPLGICRSIVSSTGQKGWYLDRRICCLGQEDWAGCPQWRTWSQVLFGTNLVFVNFIAYVWISTISATLATMLVMFLAPYAVGSGIPEVKTILGGFIFRGFLGFRTLIIKTVAMPLAVGSGGLVLDKESSLIHISAAIGHFVTHTLFPFGKYRLNEAKYREILSAACASGISVAFGAPIGGVLFSLEEMSSFFPVKTLWRSFVCAMFGLVTLQLVDPYRGKRVLFQVGTGWDGASFLSGDMEVPGGAGGVGPIQAVEGGWGMWELGIFALLGAFGGLFGVLFVRFNLKLQVWRDAWYAKVSTIQPPPMDDVDFQDLSSPTTLEHVLASFTPRSDTSHWFINILTKFVQVLAMIWKKLIKWTSYLFKQLRSNPMYLPLFETALIALITSTVSYLFVFTRINDLVVLEVFFRECDSNGRKASWGLCVSQSSVESQVFLVLIMTMLIKAIAVTVTYGAKVPGGVFIPSMMVGACFGRLVAMMIVWAQQASPDHWIRKGWCKPDEVGLSGQGGCVQAGAYALLGAVSCWGGVTRLTVSLTVIMFELTGQLNLVVPCMFCLTITKFVASQLSQWIQVHGKSEIVPISYSSGGFFDYIIRMRGYPYLDHKDDYNIGTNVSSVMTSWTRGGLIVLDRDSMTVSEVENMLKTYDFHGYPIVYQTTPDPNRSKDWTLPTKTLLGYISRQDLEFALSKVRLNYVITDSTRLVFGEVSGPVTLASPTGWGGGRMHTGVIFVDAQRENSRTTLRAVDLRSYMDPAPITIHPDLPVETAVDMFKKLGCKYLLVTERDFLVGLVTKKDVLKVLDDSDPLDSTSLQSRDSLDQLEQSRSSTPEPGNFSNLASRTVSQIPSRDVTRENLFSLEDEVELSEM